MFHYTIVTALRKRTAEGVPTVRKLIRVVEDVGADEEVGGRHIVRVEELVERLGCLWKQHQASVKDAPETTEASRPPRAAIQVRNAPEEDHRRNSRRTRRPGRPR